MARKRLISPDFFKHSELYEAEAEAGLPLRLGFAGLWCHADKRGVFRWRARELQVEIMPYDQATKFGEVLDALLAFGFVVRYEVGGKEYGFIPSFTKWQTFHRNEQPSLDPAPPPSVLAESNTAHASARGWIPRDIRRAVVERDRNQCVQCASTQDLTVDHIVPHARGGTNDATNLQVLCRACGAKKRRRGSQPQETAQQPTATEALPSPHLLQDVATDATTPVTVAVTGTVTGTGTGTELPPRLAAAGYDSRRRREGGEDGLAAEEERQLHALLDAIPDNDARKAIERFLAEHSPQDGRRHRLAARFCGWRNGAGTTAGLPISWSAIAEGLNELLDVNRPGRRITPHQALSFVESAQRRTRHVGGERSPHGDALNRASRPPMDTSALFHSLAVHYAREGDADWLRYCDNNGISYHEEAVA